MFKLKEIEKLESHYLEKFFHFLKFAEDELFIGFQTKEKIKKDWIDIWQPTKGGKGISSFSTGAERIVYALFNGKGLGQPNSAPVGSDLFFEMSKAFVHIDLKTVQTRNIGDYNKDIFIGKNQNSYNGYIKLQSGEKRKYNPALPHIYENSGNPKPCLTFFVTILYYEKTLDILNINLLSMPNGKLKNQYGAEILKAGKAKNEVRYKFSQAPNFKLLDNKKRIKVVYFDDKMDGKWLNKLSFIENIYNEQ
ncbi:MAG: hypothetical protein U9Q27_02745 [Patescibacteria group bacterium]|nr:hypothetical protein [Patescibacteria group bacterium]